ncbi:MAG: glycerol-3-phosphate acyltransferase [Candidatus Izimaplasma sp.]|nr:glycerol-3-phosphate acyltransferase [Candidatus Izimaplasma bacterium]
MEYLIIIIIGYLIGSINPAVIIARAVKGIDIREVNTGNAGTSNAVITLGLKYGILVGVIDLLKGLLPVIVLRILFPENEIIWFIGGISVIIGHVYPIFLKFKGGKGTATYGGMLFAIAPLYTLILLIIFILVTLKSDFVTIATMVVIVIAPIAMYFLGYHYISIILVSLYAFLSFYKHYHGLVDVYNKDAIGLKEVFNKD